MSGLKKIVQVCKESPPSEPIEWVATKLTDVSGMVLVEAQNWFTARQLGMAKLGCDQYEIQVVRCTPEVRALFHKNRKVARRR